MEKEEDKNTIKLSSNESDKENEINSFKFAKLHSLASDETITTTNEDSTDKKHNDNDFKTRVYYNSVTNNLIEPDINSSENNTYEFDNDDKNKHIRNSEDIFEKDKEFFILWNETVDAM